GRVWDMRQKTQQTAKSFSSVLLERISGLHVMTFFAFMAAWLTPWVADYPAIRLLSTSLFLGVSGIVIVLLETRLAILLYSFIPNKYRDKFIQQTKSIIQIYRSQTDVLIQTWFISASIQLCTLLGMYFQIQT